MAVISGERLLFLIKISTMQFKNPISIQELIKVIDIKRANFTPVKKILLDNKIAIERETFGNAKLLDINIRALDNYIKKSNIYTMVSDYIKFKDPLLHQP